jgi:hypothetical protein
LHGNQQLLTISGMFGVKRHLRVGSMTVTLLILGCGPLQAAAASSTAPALTPAVEPALMFTELQTANENASEEFIEIYNTTDADIDLADTQNGGKDVWKIQFFSSTATAAGTPDWTKPATTVALAGTVPAHDYFVVASTGYKPVSAEPNQTISSRLADTGGGLQLVRVSASTQVAHDRLMWKKSSAGEILPADILATPPAKGSLQRLPDDNDTYISADGKLTPFTSAETISPYDKWTAPLPVVAPVSDPVAADDALADPDADVTAAANTGLDAPVITELLPNPATPQKDEADEYIELYNPNDVPFDLRGYILEVGTTSLHDYTIPSGTTVAARSYSIFFSRDTKLSLTNTGSQAKLLDPAEVSLTETGIYSAAPEGQSWVSVSDSWQWSTTPTPGAANIITAPAIALKTTTATKASTSSKKTPVAKKAVTVKKASVAKAKTTAKVKTKKAAAPKKKKVKTAVATVAKISEKAPRAPIHTGVLALVVGAAVLYAAYEYRHDLSNKLRKLRGNRGTRAFARA